MGLKKYRPVSLQCQGFWRMDLYNAKKPGLKSHLFKARQMGVFAKKVRNKSGPSTAGSRGCL